MSELPPAGADSEEEEEQHEDEAGADVQDHTQTHVHAVETHTQDPNPTSCPPTSLRRNFLLLLHPWSRASGLRFQLLLGLPPRSSSSCSSVLLWRLRRSQGVFGRQVGGAVVMPEETKDVVLVPDVDAVCLLVAGGAEGGAWPRRFREEGVVTQSP